jgi:hypothetical protein
VAYCRDIETWINLASLKANEIWMLQTSDLRPDGSGFAVFANHDDAKACLSLDGRLMGDRTVQVIPVSEKELDDTVAFRKRFPVSFH